MGSIVSGFGGLRTDAETLVLNPSIPSRWKAYRFKIFYAGSLLSVEVDADRVRFKIVGGPGIRVEIYGQSRLITPEGLELPISRPPINP